MKIGFTGTRGGMNEKQRISVLELVKRLNPQEAHHGDCRGADKQFQELCRVISRTRVEEVWTIAHPPLNPMFRAYCDAHAIREPQNYLERNRAIVDESDVMIAAPAGMIQPKSLKGQGTWSTIEYARKRGKPLYIVYPNGEVKTERVIQESVSA